MSEIERKKEPAKPLSKNRPSNVPDTLREKVLERDVLCVYCGDFATEIDHLIPYSFSYDDSFENLVGSCSICNNIAHDFMFDSFENKRLFIMGKRHNKKYLNRYISKALCTKCKKPFKPGVKDTNVFYCADCKKEIETVNQFPKDKWYSVKTLEKIEL